MRQSQKSSQNTVFQFEVNHPFILSYPRPSDSNMALAPYGSYVRWCPHHHGSQNDKLTTSYYQDNFRHTPPLPSADVGVVVVRLCA